MRSEHLSDDGALRLRTLNSEDAAKIREFLSTADLPKHTTSPWKPVSVRDCEAFIAKSNPRESFPTSLRYAVETVSKTGEWVLEGHVDLNNIDWRHRCAELGVTIWSPRRRRHGIGQLACSTLLEWAFDVAGLERIAAVVFANNTASLSLFARLGFSKEGILRSCFFVSGKRIDGVQLAVLAHEWRKRRETP